MQTNYTTTIKVNKVKISFTRRKMTAYGGFALVAAFFERIGLAEMIDKALPITVLGYMERLLPFLPWFTLGPTDFLISYT